MNKKISSTEHCLLSKRLKDIRLYLKKNQKDWAEMIGVNRSDVSKLEKNTKMITAIELVKIAKVQNLNTKWLLTGEGTMWLEQKKKASIPLEKQVAKLRNEVQNLKTDLRKREVID